MPSMTAMQRDIHRALTDFGRPIDDDVTLTTAVRELIAALSESEQDADRRVLRAIEERDVARGEVDRLTGKIGVVGDALHVVGIAQRSDYEIARAVFAYADWITARTVIACVVAFVAGAGLAATVLL